MSETCKTCKKGFDSGIWISPQFRDEKILLFCSEKCKNEYIKKKLNRIKTEYPNYYDKIIKSSEWHDKNCSCRLGFPKKLKEEMKKMAKEEKMIDEPKLKDKEKVIEKLRPFWKKYWEKEEKFRNEVAELEKERTEKLGLGIKLEFFHVDNECAGIGAYETPDRKKFPLIHDSELNGPDD